MNFKESVTAGAWAGIASGVTGMVTLWLVVEPVLQHAIALENTASHSPTHDAANVHDHAGALVTRDAQLVAGLLTIFILGTLLGVIFSIVYRSCAHRLPGKTPLMTSCVLAALGYASFALIPTLMLPANPPGVGDPATVEQRTMLHLAAIACSVAIIIACFAVARSSQALPAAARTALVAATAVTGSIALFTLLPSVPQPIPESFPTDLLWQFRVASLAQITAMWAVPGILFGWLIHARRQRRTGDYGRTRLKVHG